MKNVSKTLILFFFSSAAWAQATAPISILFPSLNPSDFLANKSQYQLYQFDPNSHLWNSLAFTGYQSGNAIGLLAPVSTFNGQYAITKKVILPTSNHCSDFAPNNIRGGSSTTLTIAGGAITRGVEFKLFDISGSLVTSFSQSLEPGTYTLNISNFNVAFSAYIIVIQVDGAVVLKQQVIAGN